MSNSIPYSLPVMFCTCGKSLTFLALIFLLTLSEVGGAPGIFKVEKTTLPGAEFPLAGLALFDEQTKGWRILGHPFVLKFQIRCLLMGAPCDVIGRWLKRKG